MVYSFQFHIKVMAFWAMKAFEKVKGISQQTTKKLKGYVQSTPERSQAKTQPIEHGSPKFQAKIVSEEELMEIQLREYKKMVALQQRVFQEYEQRERKKLQARQKELQELNSQLMQRQSQERANRQKLSLIREIESGQSKQMTYAGSIQDVIRENIKIKEQLYLASQS